MFFIIGWALTVVFIVGGILILCLMDEEMGILPAAIGIVAAVIMGVITGFWVASDKQAKMINARYGTDYTAKELFYTESVVKMELAAKFGIKNVNEIGE